MLWEFSIFFLTLVYLGILWVAYSYPASLFWPGAFFLLILLVSVRAILRRYIFFFFPALLAVGTVLLLPLIDSPAQAKAFLALSTGVFYFSILGAHRLGRYKKDQTAKAMLNLAAFSVLFCWFSSGYGWYLNVQMPIWIIMVAFALVTFPISYILLVINELNLNKYQRILYSIFLSYLIAGAIWMQNFWPFGYLTTGVITLIIYYSGWDIIRSYFLEKLAFQRIVFNILFLAGTASLLLLSTKWYPAI